MGGVEGATRAYGSFGHIMLDGERDALNRGFPPAIEHNWAQELFDKEGLKGNARVDVLLKSGAWQTAFLIGVDAGGYKITVLLGEGDKTTELTNTPEFIAPVGMGAEWQRKVMMIKSADASGLVDDENEPLLAGEEWRNSLRVGSILDCQHHSNNSFRLAVVTSVEFDASAQAYDDDAAAQGGQGEQEQNPEPSNGDKLGIHFIGHPTSHDWTVARGSPYIVRPRMITDAHARHYYGDEVEAAAVPDGYIDPVSLGWAREDLSMLEKQAETRKPMSITHRPYGQWCSTAQSQTFVRFLKYKVLVDSGKEDVEDEEMPTMFAIQGRLRAAADKANQLAL